MLCHQNEKLKLEYKGIWFNNFEKAIEEEVAIPVRVCLFEEHDVLSINHVNQTELFCMCFLLSQNIHRTNVHRTIVHRTNAHQ